MAGHKLLTWLTASQASHNQTFPGCNTARGGGLVAVTPPEGGDYDDTEHLRETRPQALG